MIAPMRGDGRDFQREHMQEPSTSNGCMEMMIMAGKLGYNSTQTRKLLRREGFSWRDIAQAADDLLFIQDATQAKSRKGE
jgi:hypothetical protein